MPFGNITAQGVVYESRSPGRYTRSTVAFGQPDNSFVIRGAVAQSEAGILRASVSRILQKDVTVSGAILRRTATFTGSLVVPAMDYTALELDSLASDVAEFYTANTITRMLMGES